MIELHCIYTMYYLYIYALLKSKYLHSTILYFVFDNDAYVTFILLYYIFVLTFTFNESDIYACLAHQDSLLPLCVHIFYHL